MQEHEILDVKPIEQVDIEQKIIKKSIRRQLVCFILGVINTYLATFVLRSHIYNMAFPFDVFTETMRNLFNYVLGIPIMGLLFGAIAAYLPYKKLPYQKKYFRAATLIALSVQTFTTFLLVMMVITYLNKGEKLFNL